MKKLTSNEMRKMWYEFWQTKNHQILESAPLIPDNDPTLLWINAGVAPLKKYFDGSVTPTNRRIANSQKCIRTNDIENVGKTARHHTFFEMLGNFSIGDYFKTEAITWSYEFLTKWLEMDPDKLYATIYTNDEEALKLWKKVGMKEDHIIRLEGNFWEIGPGPSGPDSEIFFDRGEKYDPKHQGLKLLQEEIENDRYIEIWNNVFSQFNATEGLDRSEYPELPSKNIDTGMGLERMCCVLQEVETNFDTDLFMPIIRKIEEISGQTYNGDMPFKVIADHVRALTFALADGATFGNTGRDYVLRRLLRRAVRYGKVLGIKRPFMSELVDVVVDIMKEAYPNLVDSIQTVKYKINQEEELFRKTLINGEKKLEEIFARNDNNKISGEEAFRLYDTYGFPFELTLEYASERGFTVSKEDFDAFMKEQQIKASIARGNKVSMNQQNESLLAFDLKSTFIGYEKEACETKIIALFDGEKFTSSLLGDGYLVLEETPFYAEAGGQVSDSGLIDDAKVLDLFKGPHGQVFHHVDVQKEWIVGQNVKASIDVTKRNNIRKNHSATHLLQKALQQVLTSDVHQMGSYVDDKRLRFDFRYEYKISRKEIMEVEALVQEKIDAASQTNTLVMSIDEALKTGAMALFSDKYGDKVRVVTMGDSKELCGGTHVFNTADIKRFAIVSLDSKGSNVYRVEATTDTNIEPVLFEAIKPYNDEMMKLLQKAKDLVEKAASYGIELPIDYNLFAINHDKPMCYQDIIFNLEEVSNIKNIVMALEKNYQELRNQQALNDLSLFENKIEVIAGINAIILKLENYDQTALKEVVDTLENKHAPACIFLANLKNGNVNFIAKASKDLPYDMGKLVKTAANKCGGNGGGSKTFAQGGGVDTKDVDKVLEAIRLVLEGKHE